ncbi:MAG: Rieske 2Fe-2S domain-containing protein [Candidatus Hydrogenedentota bacterium]
MPIRVPAGKSDDLKSGETRRLEIEGDTVCVLNVEGAFYAISNICPHASAPMDQGFVENCRITCSWHGWSFQLDCPEDDIPRDGLWRYRIHVDDGDLFIETPAINA